MGAASPMAAAGVAGKAATLILGTGCSSCPAEAASGHRRRAE